MAKVKRENIDFGKLKPRALAHYFGCKIKVYLRNQPPYIATLTPAFLGDTTGVKPILRPLSDMTKKEHGEYRKLFEEQIFSKTHEARKHAERTAYLLSRYLDVFDWIDAGLAIDATTLSPNPYDKILSP